MNFVLPRANRLLLLTLLASIGLVAGLIHVAVVGSSEADSVNAGALPKQTTPLPICEFGVNVLGDVTQFDMAPLRMGWYLDYRASSTPARPNGSEYALVVRLSQDGPNSYTYSPNADQLPDIIAANPGAVWLIGNEPDRRGNNQDDVEPHIYASAYHELYALIKQADPTARIFAGAIVQPTPIRLQYLDMVLDSYEDSFGVPMPVDGWSIHNFLLNEVNEDRCDEVPPEILPNSGCSGAGVPPGIDVLYGELLALEQHDDMDIFVERIRRFRQWMADRGYRGLPVYLSEYGILMPNIFAPPADYPPERVNQFMNNTFDYMMAETDVLLGDPNDGHRLVQKWSWYSTSDTFFNGWLFNPATFELSPMGQNYADYVAGLEAKADLYPSRIFAEPNVPFSHGETVTITLKATLANSGHQVQPTQPTAVRFYEGDPAVGGVQIGEEKSVSLTGCGDNWTVEVQWSNVGPGAHQTYVVVDPDGLIDELDDSNNVADQVILVATDQLYLPLIGR